MSTNTLKHTVNTLKPSLRIAMGSCILFTSLNAYAQDLSRQALDATPFWIGLIQLYKEVDPPAINLSSIKITAQNPQWRTVDFYDSWANVELSEGSAKNLLTLHSANIPSTNLTVDCTSYTVQGGLPRLQPQYWADMSDKEQLKAQAAQDIYEKLLAQLTCSASLSLKPHEWIDVGQAIGRKTDPQQGLPLTEYDRNNITTDPKNIHLRTVIAKDTFQIFGKATHIYRHTFNCQNKTLQQNNHYVIKNGDTAYDETYYETFAKLHVIDDMTGQSSEIELFSSDIESQSEDLIYIFQQVCK